MLRQFVLLKQQDQVPDHLTVRQMKTWLLTRRNFVEDQIEQEVQDELDEEKRLSQLLNRKVTLEGLQMFVTFFRPKAEKAVRTYLPSLFSKLLKYFGGSRIPPVSSGDAKTGQQLELQQSTAPVIQEVINTTLKFLLEEPESADQIEAASIVVGRLLSDSAAPCLPQTFHIMDYDDSLFSAREDVIFAIQDMDNRMQTAACRPQPQLSTSEGPQEGLLEEKEVSPEVLLDETTTVKTSMLRLEASVIIHMEPELDQKDGLLEEREASPEVSLDQVTATVRTSLSSRLETNMIVYMEPELEVLQEELEAEDFGVKRKMMKKKRVRAFFRLDHSKEILSQSNGAGGPSGAGRGEAAFTAAEQDVSLEKEEFWSELDEVVESVHKKEGVVIGMNFNGYAGEGNRGDEEVMGSLKEIGDCKVRAYLGSIGWWSDGDGGLGLPLETKRRKRMKAKPRIKWLKLKKEDFCGVQGGVNTDMVPRRETGKKRQGENVRVKYNQWREDRMEGAIKEYREAVEAGQNPKLPLILGKGMERAKVNFGKTGQWEDQWLQTCLWPYLSKAAEKELSSIVKMLSRRGFPLGKKDIQKLAFSFSKANGIKCFLEAKGSAGYYWFNNFMKRHKELKIKKLEALSAARAAGLNPVVVGKWFEEYEALLTELNIVDVPSHLWNCDESGLQDQFCSTQLVGEVGKQCVEITAGETGETTTVLAAFSAVGQYSRTLLIFKGKRLRMEWLYGCPSHVIASVSENGWINSELFVECGKLFVQQLPKDDLRPHVLLLDGHNSHVYNMPFLQLMKDNNVHVMCYPSHTTHVLQPADKALFKSLKHNWYEEGRRWMREGAGLKLPKTEFFSLFSKAWQKTATVENAQAGFRGTGMFPLNKNIVPAEVYAPMGPGQRRKSSDHRVLRVAGQPIIQRQRSTIVALQCSDHGLEE
eukprot:superscaffoldBa00000903_g7918